MGERIVFFDDHDKTETSDVALRSFFHPVTGAPLEAHLCEVNWRRLCAGEITVQQIETRPRTATAQPSASSRRRRRGATSSNGPTRAQLTAFVADHPELGLPKVNERGRLPQDAVVAWKGANDK